LSDDKENNPILEKNNFEEFFNICILSLHYLSGDFMRLIILAGMPGSGKEEFLVAAREANWQFIRMGDVVREEYEAKGIATTGINLGQFAQNEREEHGYHIWAERAISNLDHKEYIIDGCRGMAEIEAFKSHTPNVLIVAVHSSPKSRFERLCLRGRSDAPLDWLDFIARDQREISWGLAEVIAQADYMLVNDTDLQSYHNKVRSLMGRLLDS